MECPLSISVICFFVACVKVVISYLAVRNLCSEKLVANWLPICSRQGSLDFGLLLIARLSFYLPSECFGNTDLSS